MSDIAILNLSKLRIAEAPAILRLPPEILEHIFSICVLWLYVHEKPLNSFAWTQVCKTWRNIAFSCGRLWQRIDLSDLTCAAEFLVRSKRVPLYITATSPIKGVPSNLVLHASRLCSIDVVLAQDEITEFFASIGQSLPTLTNLSVRMTPIVNMVILNIYLPCLRRLSLQGVSLPWKECRNLTYFSVRGYSQGFLPSLSQLLAIFRSSPDLEYVRLESFVPSSKDLVVIESSPVALHSLNEFIVSSYPSVIRSLLSFVVLGTRTRLQLFVSGFEDLGSVFPTNHATVGYENFSIGTNNVRISRHGVCVIPADAPIWCDDPSVFRVSLCSESLAAEHVCTSLDYVADLVSITRLELNVGVLLDIPPHTIQSLFRDLSRLESLCTAFNEMVDLLHILQSIDETTGLVYLPHLVKLSFGKPADTWWHFDDRWIESILKVLETRRDCGYNLQILELFSCQGVKANEALASVASEVMVIGDSC